MSKTSSRELVESFLDSIGLEIRLKDAASKHHGWHEAVAPGYFEVDLVAHNGGDIRGSFAHMLTM